jgi:hypothetical protein
MKKAKLPVILMAMFVLALGCLAAWFIFNSNQTAMFPTYGWTIAGRVCDEEAHPITGVNVTAQGATRVTFANRVFGTSVQGYLINTNTDEEGRFTLRFEASDCQLSFVKSGYISQSTNFFHYENLGQDTNPVVGVVLKTENRTTWK